MFNHIPLFCSISSKSIFSHHPQICSSSFFFFSFCNTVRPLVLCKFSWHFDLLRECTQLFLSKKLTVTICSMPTERVLVSKLSSQWQDLVIHACHACCCMCSYVKLPFHAHIFLCRYTTYIVLIQFTLPCWQWFLPLEDAVIYIVPLGPNVP